MCRELRRELEAFRKKRDCFLLVGGIERPATAFHIRADIPHERITIGLRPVPHHECAVGLIGTNRLRGGAHILQSGLPRTEGERRIDDRGHGVGLILGHGLEPRRRRAHWFDRVVAFVEPVVFERFVQQQAEGSIWGIDHDRFAAKIGQGIDLWLHEDAVVAVVAASHDNRVRLGEFDHCHRVVDPSLGDLIIALRQPVTHHVGVRRIGELDVDAGLGKQIFVLGCENREVGQAGEDDDLQRRLGRCRTHCSHHRGAGEGADPKR